MAQQNGSLSRWGFVGVLDTSRAASIGLVAHGKETPTTVAAAAASANGTHQNAGTARAQTRYCSFVSGPICATVILSSQ